MGHIHEVHRKGSSVIAFHGGIKILNNVLYVPRVKENLLLVGAIANMGCVMIFGRTNCWIIIVYTPHKIIATSQKDLTNGLYKFTIAILQKVSQNSPTPLMIERQPKISLWHERLGHISIQGVHELSKEGHSTVLPYILIINIVCDKVCWESNTRKSCQQRAQ